MSRRYAVIAGGGTAGHVHPGLAVARALVRRGHDASSILFVGSERGIEAELVPAAGFELVALPGRGISRQLSFDAARSAASLLHGAWLGTMLLGQEHPAVVLSLGGFAAFPCALGARLRRIPVVVHEQNAVPGAANRLISRWAAASAVSFAGTPLRRSVVTGNPVRDEILAVDRAADRMSVRTSMGVGDRQTLVAVTGGSLGALALNRAILDAAMSWQDRVDLVVHHIVGSRDWDLLAEERALAAAGRLDYRAVRYEHDMAAVLTAADVVLSRAGASTTAEIAVVGVAAILVPLPGAPGDHQTANARALVEAGGALMVRDSDLDGPCLCRMVESLLETPNTLEHMAAAATVVGRRDAADRVAQLMEEHAR